MSEYWPWVAGLFGWLAWFTFFEWRGFKHKNATLSMSIYQLGAHFPLSIFLIGMVVGGLATHFYWHWCPVGSISAG